MNFDIALILVQDGITNGAVYALLGIALILVFTITRITFVPQGEFVSYGALSLASIQQGYAPKTIYLLLIMGYVAAAIELWQNGKSSRTSALRLAAIFAGYPTILAAVVLMLPSMPTALPIQIAMTLAIVVPLGPICYRVIFQPMASASVLVLLIAAVAMHLAMVGLGLLAFGPEGSRTVPLTTQSIAIGPMLISGQSIAVIVVSAILIGVMFWAFGHTIYGKALRATAVNQTGARLVGIQPELSGAICFSLAAGIGAMSGILLSPITAIYYDSGLIIALKGFVAAIVGGLTSYLAAAAGAIVIGLIESFSSFWASAFKETILFLVVIPILLWRCAGRQPLLDEAK